MQLCHGGHTESKSDLKAVIFSFSIPGGSWGSALGSGHHFSALGVCFGLLCDWQHPLHSYNGKVCAALRVLCAGKGAELTEYNLLFGFLGCFDLCCAVAYFILWDWISMRN